jgi:release factor glutamine methyltransferase
MISVREATRTLERAGVSSPEHDARALIRHANQTGSAPDDLIEARASRVPLQHILGSAGFRYLDLAVGPGVFVPRPETELLVDAVMAALDGNAAPRVVDLCAGSGAIGLSVAHEHRGATVDLVETSAAAFAWLSRNVADRDRVTIHHADLADAPADCAGMIDVVVSNPPYLPLDERELVDPEVRDHDPADALWGGQDGLEVIRRVVDRATGLLRRGGTLVVEHSDRQGQSVPELLERAGFSEIAGHNDLTGRPRFATGIWP